LIPGLTGISNLYVVKLTLDGEDVDPNKYQVTYPSHLSEVSGMSGPASIVFNKDYLETLPAKPSFKLHMANDTAVAAIILQIKLLGDVNGDGKINAIDASLVLQYDAKLIGETGLNVAVADVNGDGKTDAIDAALILQYDAKLIDAFPVDQSNSGGPEDSSFPDGSSYCDTDKEYLYLKKDDALTGESVPFNNGPVLYVSDDSFNKSEFVVISSAAKIAMLNREWGCVFPDKYDCAFFEENMLIVKAVPELSGSYRMRVDSLIKNNGEICLRITVLTPSGGDFTDDVNFRYILTEMKKQDAFNVTKFSYFEVHEQYSH